jgi:phenylacetaldehyde dehydrogenase
MEPAIFVDTRPDMRIVREEIFGPVLSVQSFDGDGIDDIIAQANDTPYGLAASVWTQDISRAMRVAYKIKAGEVGINVHGIPDSIAPFGGYKQSGWGRENGAEGLEPYLQTKTIWAHI